MRLHSLKYSLLYVASSVKGKCEYSETNSLYVCECVYMCKGETSFYFMQCNMSELYVIFMTEVSFFNSWPISLEMSFRIKYVVRVIHCCPRTRTRYTHTHVRTASFCRSHEERTCDWDIRARNFKKVRPQPLPSESCKSLADFAQWRASWFARNKKWATAISRVNYPAVSKLKLPARLPNILRT